MKKSFYFALALTAGLFASCSSDDISQAPGLNGVEGNPEGAINLSVANGSQGVTRGTGTVGSANGNDEQWAGQKVKVFMLKQGTLDLAYEMKDDGTEDNTKPLFSNQEMVVEAGSPALILDIAANAEDANWKDRTVTTKYFPGSGVFDFWGYRTDGAEGANAPVNDANDEVKSINFEIDGSQDLMSGKATPLTKANVAATDYGYWNAAGTKVYGNYGGTDQEVDPSKIYSAYSARRNIDPVLSFTHRLARFTFQIKGANIDACIATGETDADKIAKAVNITKITVKDVTNTGNLVIAYKDGLAAVPEPITFNATPTADLVLKQRQKKVISASVGSFYAIKVNRGADDANGDPTYTYSVKTTAEPTNDAFTPGNATMVAGIGIDDDLEVYDGYGTDANTGLPEDNKTTIGDIANAIANANSSSATYYFYKETTPVQYSQNDADIDKTANLVTLEPVQPTYTGTTLNKVGVGEALLLPAGVTQYDIEVTVKQRLTQTTQTTVDANGNPIYVDDVTNPTKFYLLSPGATTAVNAVYSKAVEANATNYNNAAAANKFTATNAATTEALFVTELETWLNTEDHAIDGQVIYAAYTDAAATPVTHYYKVNVIKAYVPIHAAHYYEKANVANHYGTVGSQIAVATVEQDNTGTYFKWEAKAEVDKTQVVKQRIKLQPNAQSGTDSAFQPGTTYNVVLTVNGFEGIDGQQKPTVVPYVTGEEIELDDETQLP